MTAKKKNPVLRLPPCCIVGNIEAGWETVPEKEYKIKPIATAITDKSIKV